MATISRIQRGKFLVSGSISGTATILSVNLAKTEFHHIGDETASLPFVGRERLELTNSTTITGTRGTSSGSSNFGYSLTEWA